MANKNLEEVGKATQFKKGNKHGKGRPKKLTSAVLQELESEGYEEVTQAHVKEAYQRLINLDQEKLTELYNDKKVAMLIRIVAKAILDKKGFEIIEKMLDRAHGKATNKTEVTGADGKDLYKPLEYDKLSLDELRRLKEIADKLEGDTGGDS